MPTIFYVGPSILEAEETLGFPWEKLDSEKTLVNIATDTVEKVSQGFT